MYATPNLTVLLRCWEAFLDHYQTVSPAYLDSPHGHPILCGITVDWERVRNSEAEALVAEYNGLCALDQIVRRDHEQEIKVCQESQEAARQFVYVSEVAYWPNEKIAQEVADYFHRVRQTLKNSQRQHGEAGCSGPDGM